MMILKIFLHFTIFTIMVLEVVSSPRNPKKGLQKIIEETEINELGLAAETMFGGGLTQNIQNSRKTFPSSGKPSKNLSDNYPVRLNVQKLPIKPISLIGRISKHKPLKATLETKNTTEDADPTMTGVSSSTEKIESDQLDQEVEKWAKKVMPKVQDGYMEFARSYILCEKDLKSIKDGNRLTNYIIDYTIINIIGAHVFSPKNKYAYLFAELGTRFITNEKILGPENLINRMKLKNKIVLMPMNFEDDHWCLLIADTGRKNVQYYDPIKTSIENFEKCKTILKSFLKLINKRNTFVDQDDRIDDNEKNWVLKQSEIEIHLQEDSYNCGIHVIMYIDCFMHNHYKSCAVEADAYRKLLQKTILYQII